MAKGFYHDVVIRALEKDGWIITDNPLNLADVRYGYLIDLGAERLVAATRESEKIAVEIKSFVGKSFINEFHRAIGQFNDYTVAIELLNLERKLYLAVPQATYEEHFHHEVIRKALIRADVNVVVYNPITEKIALWEN